MQQLNIQAKNMTDLLTGEAFTRKDIITIQDPQDLGKRDLTSFNFIKLRLSGAADAGMLFLFCWIGLDCVSWSSRFCDAPSSDEPEGESEQAKGLEVSLDAASQRILSEYKKQVCFSLVCFVLRIGIGCVSVLQELGYSFSRCFNFLFSFFLLFCCFSQVGIAEAEEEKAKAEAGESSPPAHPAAAAAASSSSSSSSHKRPGEELKGADSEQPPLKVRCAVLFPLFRCCFFFGLDLLSVCLFYHCLMDY